MALGLLLQRGRRIAQDRSDGALRQLLDTASGEVRAALADIRDVSRGMHPWFLVDCGLAAAVDALAERLPIDVTTKVTVNGRADGAELTVYYVVAESLTNVAKHAGASHAAVVIRHEGPALMVRVTDDGAGGAELRHGSGLQGLSDRVAAAGGTLRLDSQAGREHHDRSGDSVRAMIADDSALIMWLRQGGDSGVDQPT